MRRAIRKRCWVLVIAILSVTSLFCWSQAYAHAGHTGLDDPWKAGELIQPSDLVRLLASDEKPLVVQVGIIHLFRLGHIPGAQYAGPASTPEGIAALKKLVANVPHSREVVFYCGCCPMPDCPNIRPAYQALREMGFKQIRLLDLPTNFTQDWQMKGLPVEKGGI